MKIEFIERIKYFVSLLIENHPDVDLSDADSNLTQEYHNYCKIIEALEAEAD